MKNLKLKIIINDEEFKNEEEISDHEENFVNYREQYPVNNINEDQKEKEDYQ